MGTIVDKFNYSFEAKDLIKDSINNLGGSITSETELKEYAQELQDIYNNIPKTTDTGTNLSLNTIKGKMEITPKGDTSQNGTPTPDTPIDIEVVTGTQTIQVSNSDNTESQTQTISLGNIELCKIGNYQDYLYKSGDKWYKKEQIGKVVLTGASGEGWSYSSGWSKTNTSVFYMSNVLQNALFKDYDVTYGICNRFIVSSRNSVNSADTNLMSYSGAIDLPQLTIRINKTIANDLTAFTQWLSSNNIEYRYIFETANDIEITNETLISQLNNLEKMYSYNGTTNISSSGNLPIVLGVSALKGSD